MKARAIALFAGLISVHAMASTEFDQYKELFPVFAQYCSGTRLEPIGSKPGGVGGHGFTYYQGLCKDYSVDYPKIIPCSKVSPELKAKWPQDGVGISVDSDFRNVNWVAVPGLDLFLNGNVADNATVDQAATDEVVSEAKRLKIFDNVKFFMGEKATPSLKSGEEHDLLTFITRATIGTDIAIRFGRTIECVRIPFPQKKLQAVADFLNSQNEIYYGLDASGNHKPEYKWSGIEDNCTHLADNALAVAGIRHAIPANQPKPQQFLHMAIPLNSTVELREIAHYLSISPLALALRPSDQQKLEQDHYLPTGVGGLSFSLDILQPNHFYSSKHLWGALLPPKPTHIGPGMDIDMLMKVIHSYEAPHTKKFTDLSENLQYWKGVYEREARFPIQTDATRDYYHQMLQKTDALIEKLQAL